MKTKIIYTLFLSYFIIQALIMLALTVVATDTMLVLGLLVAAIVLQIKEPQNYKLVMGFYIAYSVLLFGYFYLFYLFVLWHKWTPMLLPVLNLIIISLYFTYYYKNFVKNKNNGVINLSYNKQEKIKNMNNGF